MAIKRVRIDQTPHVVVDLNMPHPRVFGPFIDEATARAWIGHKPKQWACPVVEITVREGGE